MRRTSPSCSVSERYKDNLKRRYGMTVEEYIEVNNEQMSACKICRKNFPRLHVDHDHETGKVRGLLCQNCNTALGKFKDDPQLLLNAINYLESSRDEGCSDERYH